MIDHISFKTADLDRSRAFYEAVLPTLGLGLVVSVGPELTGGYLTYGYGPPGKPILWLSQGTPTDGLHLALAATDRAQVRAFYKAALEAGARDNGSPGLRLHYHPSYYAAFVLDPDGVNLEAVCHAPA